jgi:hypothetical protein
MMAVCMLSIKLLSDDMAELAFQIDLFSCCACFSDLEAAGRISFLKTLSILDHRYACHTMKQQVP